MSELARAYATTIQESEVNFDFLFGPAYKGISLAAVTAMATYIRFDKDVGFASNRKEPKDHGEGGDLIGASIEGRKVVLIDDVITTGGAKHEAFEFVRSHGGTPVAIMVAFDRQELGESTLSASQQVERDLGIPVIAAATTTELIEYLTITQSHPVELAAIKKYYAEFGVVS